MASRPTVAHLVASISAHDCESEHFGVDAIGAHRFVCFPFKIALLIISVWSVGAVNCTGSMGGNLHSWCVSWMCRVNTAGDICVLLLDANSFHLALLFMSDLSAITRDPSGPCNIWSLFVLCRRRFYLLTILLNATPRLS